MFLCTSIFLFLWWFSKTFGQQKRKHYKFTMVLTPAFAVHSLLILLPNYLIVLIILQDQKKFHEQLSTEKEALFGSQPSPARPQGSKKVSGLRANSNTTNGGNARRFAMNQNGLRSASRNGQRDAARPSAPVNYVVIAKDDVASHVSSNNPSASGSP
jgi:hypothetical protein